MSDTQPSNNIEEESAPKKTLKERLTPEKKSPAIDLGKNITVSLIPDSHKRNVDARKSKNNWTAIFGFAVIVSVVASAAMFGLNLQAESQLASERLDQEIIELSISRHAEVHQALESEQIAQQLLNSAAGNEIDWKQLVGIIEQQLPQGTDIASLAVTNGGLADDEISSSVTLSLNSTSTFGYSDSLRAVEGINGVEEVEIGGLSVSGENGYTYQMSFTYDTSILTERFSLESDVAAVEEPMTDEAPLPEEMPIEDTPVEEGE